MILTNCAACAAPLAHTAPRCVRCQTSYCNKTCQHDHWRRGHKQICKRIHRGGNAEQYNADKKYKEAVAEAVEACADDAKGRTCYICMEGVKRHTGEGLVRMCACEGTAGYAHVSCLAEQAKILVAEGKENNLGGKVVTERWRRWDECSLCGQDFQGLVKRALGWACWKTYCGQEGDQMRIVSITVLAAGERDAGNTETALQIYEACVSAFLHYRNGELDGEPVHEYNITRCRVNIAACLESLLRVKEAVVVLRENYDRTRAMLGPDEYCDSAISLAKALNNIGNYAESIALLRDIIPSSIAAFGRDDKHTLRLRYWLADALLNVGTDKAVIREAIYVFEETSPRWFRVFKDSLEDCVTTARAKLTLVDTPLPFGVGARVECVYVESDSDVSIGNLFDSSDSGSESGSESFDDDDGVKSVDSDDDGIWAPGVVVAHHYRQASFDVGYFAPYQVRLDSGGLIYVVDPAEQIRAIAQSDP